MVSERIVIPQGKQRSAGIRGTTLALAVGLVLALVRDAGAQMILRDPNCYRQCQEKVAGCIQQCRTSTVTSCNSDCYTASRTCYLACRS